MLRKKVNLHYNAVGIMPPFGQDGDTDSKEYYPALLGETLHPDPQSEVVIVRKLGWGKLSNVWLVRSAKQYVSSAILIDLFDRSLDTIEIRTSLSKS